LAKQRKKSTITLGAGSAELNSQVLTRVNPLSPNHRLVIALRSLEGVFETGLAGRPSEKTNRQMSRKALRLLHKRPLHNAGTAVIVLAKGEMVLVHTTVVWRVGISGFRQRLKTRRKLARGRSRRSESCPAAAWERVRA